MLCGVGIETMGCRPQTCCRRYPEVAGCGASEVRGANPWLSAWRCPIAAPRKPDRINRAGVFFAHAHVRTFFFLQKNEHVQPGRAGSGLDGHTGEEEEEQEESRSAAASVGRLRLCPGRRCGWLGETLVFVVQGTQMLTQKQTVLSIPA